MKEILSKLLRKETLSRETMCDILVGITKEKYPIEQISALLTCFAMREMTVDELLGFRDGILLTGVPAVLDAPRYIDIVGTGGDQKNTFNISTCACFVGAGAGYKVAKHGNVSATAVTGASNIMEMHGVKFTNDLDKLNRSINECGIAYLHAPLFALAMKFVAPIRRNISFPTIFNLLGPIVNPSLPHAQCLGVATLDQMRLYHGVCEKVGTDYALVNSLDGYDEISLTGEFKVTTNNYERVFSPSDIGMPVALKDDICGRKSATKEDSIAVFDSVLQNTALESQKNVVIANAAFAIQVLEAGKMSIEECLAKARESIDSGKALGVFKKFIELNS